MKTKYQLSFALCTLAVTLVVGCGKVTQTIGSKEPSTKAYAVLKSAISLDYYQSVFDVSSVPTQAFVVRWSEVSTQDSNVYVSLYGVRSKGTLDLLAWGQGYRPNWSTLEDPTLSHSLTRKGKKIKQAEDGTPFVQYVPGTSPHWEIEATHLTQPYAFLVTAVSTGKNRSLMLSAVDASTLTQGMTLSSPAPTHYETFITQIARLAQASHDGSGVDPELSCDALRRFYPPHIWYQLNAAVPTLIATQLDHPLAKDPIYEAFNSDKKIKTAWQPYLDLFLLRKEALPVYQSALDEMHCNEKLEKWFWSQSDPEPVKAKTAGDK